MITYWVVGGIYTFFDLTNKPEVLRQYKVQPGTNEPITYKNLFKVQSGDSGTASFCTLITLLREFVLDSRSGTFQSDCRYRTTFNVSRESYDLERNTGIERTATFLRDDSACCSMRSN